jgi:hypothetical protein
VPFLQRQQHLMPDGGAKDLLNIDPNHSAVCLSGSRTLSLPPCKASSCSRLRHQIQISFALSTAIVDLDFWQPYLTCIKRHGDDWSARESLNESHGGDMAASSQRRGYQ